MNGALYISFFQGQLEAALEQVVHLAVTEIIGSVGASLSSMLLETARKEQENQRLRGTLPSPRHAEGECGTSAEPEPRRAAPRPGSLHASLHGSYPDSLRQEQKRRAVGQLKVVMERVLEFAVHELSKVVEDSFDDVLLELRKTEQENEELMEKLHGVTEENQVRDRETNECQRDRGESPHSTAVGKEDKTPGEEEQGREPAQNPDDSAPPVVTSVSQDWVPVLDQVFGQKWCADLWPVKEPGDIKEERSCPPSEEPIREDSAPHRNDDSQSDQLQWLQNTEALTLTFDPQQQTSETNLTGDDVPLKSPSMLHRLLTLPSQMLDADDESMESEESLLNAITSLHGAQTPRLEHHNGAQDLEDQEEDQVQEEECQEDAKPMSCRNLRKNHVCKNCGRKFSRATLLKAHRLTHKETRSPFAKLHAHTGPEKNT